jgi:hypothetical protein
MRRSIHDGPTVQYHYHALAGDGFTPKMRALARTPRWGRLDVKISTRRAPAKLRPRGV